ncbi:UDP-glucose/GDP-mannose dehydrogenase family protein [soil metagenome]
MRVVVIGTGYVGLVTGACLADVGNDVLCIDIDAAKIEAMKQGHIPIHEDGLEALVANNLKSGRLQFSTSYDDAVAHADIVFIAVGTPSEEDGSADLSHVLDCARQLGQRITRDTVVVVKSTVPVGTNDRVGDALQAELDKRGLKLRISMASNPEFLKEGLAVDDFMRPDRIIIGSQSDVAIQAMRRLYAPFNRYTDRLMVMDARSAEFTKYAANSMLAIRISFMNELANLAEKLGADIEQVRHGIGSDGRIGPHFLYAGVGFGGSCFPKDLRALVYMSNVAGVSSDMLGAATEVNLRQRTLLARKIIEHFDGDVKGRTIALWGLAFKANTDDVREASSLAIVKTLSEAGAQVRAYDPVASETARRALKGATGVTFVGSAHEACEGADALAVVTEWREFRSPDFQWLARTLKARAVFDGRNLYDPAMVRAAGLFYSGIGRGAERTVS